MLRHCGTTLTIGSTCRIVPTELGYVNIIEFSIFVQFDPFKRYHRLEIYNLHIILTIYLSLQEMSYDLGDIARWEFMFPHNDKPLLMLPGEEEFDMPLDEEEVHCSLLCCFLSLLCGDG